MADFHLSQTSEVGKCVRCKGTGKDGHDRCDPPSWYICEDCNGTGQSELSDEEITDDLIMALLDDIYSGDNKDVIPKFRKFLEMYRTLPSESEQTVKELSDEEIRPNFKEIFGDGKKKTIFDVQDAATSQPELFRYAQALDKYIDYLESNRTHHPQLTEEEVGEIFKRLLWEYHNDVTTVEDEMMVFHKYAKEIVALSGEKGVSNGIKVGSKVIVLGTLHTEIIEIVGDTYYFLDEDGKRWSETLGGIKQVLSGEKGVNDE